MAGTTTLTFGQLMLIALGPATLAAGVGLLAPWFTDYRKGIAERRTKRAEKFEELLTTIFEHKHWLDIKSSVYVFGEKRELPPAPISKALAIAVAYLPELSADVARIEAASFAYEKWMVEAGQQRLANGGAPVIVGFDIVFKTFLTEMEAAMKNIKDFPKGNFG